MRKELVMRSAECAGETVETIYFGGGTPSLLRYEDLMPFFDVIHQHYRVSAAAEVTMEANPDDLSSSALRNLKRTPLNRLSIGIQSFRDEDLVSMNRAHTAAMALACVPDAATVGFSNISVDLIFGLPFLKMEHWQQNVRTALSLPVTHLSCYGLTIEPKTALSWQITKGLVPSPDEETAAAQYAWLLEEMESNGFPWYEISNFSKPGFESRHNTSYWKGFNYLGIGPSSHSFNGRERSWNVKSNAVYIKEISEGKRPSESEQLSRAEQFHELILTSLRVRRGLNLLDIRNRYGASLEGQLIEEAGKFVDKGWVAPIREHIRLTKEGLLFADKITSELFII